MNMVILVVIKHFTTRLKGLVHPKLKILSVISHPHVVPNPVRLMFIFGTQNKIFLIKSEGWLTPP